MATRDKPVNATLATAWSISGPLTDSTGTTFWTWRAIGPHGSQSGWAPTKEDARLRAEEVWKRLNR